MADIATIGIAVDTRGLKIGEQALDEFARTTKQTSRAVDTLQSELVQTGNAGRALAPRVNNVAASMGRLRGSVQNAAFQLQDIVVQIQGGTSATRALSQQIPQLLGGFGALGAVLGLVAGLGIPLVSTLFDLEGGAEDAADAADEYTDALEALAEQVKDNIRLQQILNGTWQGDIVEPLIIGVQKAEQALLDAEGAYQKVIDKQNELFELGARRGSLDVRAGDIEPGSARAKQIADAEAAVADAAAKVREARNAQADAFELESRKNLLKQKEKFEEDNAKRGLKAVIDARRQIEQAERDSKREIDKIKREEVAAFEKAEREKEQIAKAATRAREQAEKDAARENERIAQRFESSFENAFTGIIDGTKSVKEAFSDMASGIISDIARIVVQKNISGPIGKFLGGLDFGSMFGGGVDTSMSASLAPTAGGGYVGPFANGGAFNSSGLIPFANGGVVNRPTVFPFANGTGLMGEAGPEAIMPLSRGRDGKLGVAGGGGGQVVNINITNENGGEVEAQQNGPNIDVIIRRSVARDVAEGGTVFSAISKTFNIQPGLNRRG